MEQSCDRDLVDLGLLTDIKPGLPCGQGADDLHSRRPAVIHVRDQMIMLIPHHVRLLDGNDRSVRSALAEGLVRVHGSAADRAQRAVGESSAR
ncbi:hypothetical protein AB0F73_22100 [Micromonospora purpureochromogenes]|uniref:hypothetical protein n=1 Tax=Micromonospora purpureochromogenes TaxID=47872 RepID=UPI0033C39F50